MREGLGFFSGSGFDDCEALAIAGIAHEYVAKNAVRVAAGRGSDAATAACNSVSCCLASGGQATDMLAIFSTVVFRVAESSRLAAMRLSSSKAARLFGWTVRIFSTKLWNSAGLLSSFWRSISSAS